MNVNEKSLDNYDVLAVMGSGSFATCKKVRDRSTGELFVLQSISYDKLDEIERDALFSEVGMLRELQHHNIVQYHHQFDNRVDKVLHIVMECCAGGDLAQFVERARTQRRRFEERFIKRAPDMAMGWPMDTAPPCTFTLPGSTSRILILASTTTEKASLIPPICMVRDLSLDAAFVGTPVYMSPELLRGRSSDRKSDVWALGCVVYVMCALRPPFRGSTFALLSERILQGVFRRIPAVYGSDLQEIISAMLIVDREQRPDVEVFVRHPLVIRNASELGDGLPNLVEAEGPSPCSSSSTLPILPFGTMEGLREFDTLLLSNEEAKQQMKSKIRQIDGIGVARFTRNVLKAVLVERLSVQLSWRGTRTKPSFQKFNLFLLIKDYVSGAAPRQEVRPEERRVGPGLRG
ncbi:serine/threonine-protein kinase Nek2-like [Drosophila serrata]|uniref:serine/threonine-protein kinase Nek2-like n=1 Tax=Drosophila serrata TaxID=7274 RepID=UPI000A1D14BF|nr:serine/threonine-protein kinase Nek2-like [Drosophila serrata]